MDREERTRQFAIDMEMFGDYVLEWGGEHFDYDKTANALDKLGYRKISWHKVADGETPNDKKEVLVYTKEGIYTIAFYNPVYDEFFPLARQNIIAWTRLPTYEE